MWEFSARMALARKGLQDHVAAVKPEDAVRRGTEEWKAAEMKALAVVAKMLSPTYQSMVREAASALEAWEILRAFFVKQSLHNRVQLHEFTLSSGGDLMGHIVRFDDICSRLAAVGEIMSEDEKVVILLGSLPQAWLEIQHAIGGGADRKFRLRSRPISLGREMYYRGVVTKSLK
ncbi:unnamed protein product [Phytophthora fragariaefolia]|uniref:Unnamed protein product n=1 Tax=Phytophthora fragariaefolia TaxID=1490495 RepID=A0A9W7D8U5_9STRA|nr:unnamed protein product [Phytophthora fragariaefolia]